MAVSMMKREDMAPNTGLAAVPLHHLLKDCPSERDKRSPPMGLYASHPTSLLARQMLGGLSLHATLSASPGVYAPPWFVEPGGPGSPPPTPIAPSKRVSNHHVTSTSSARRRKRIKSSPPAEEPLPEPPLSPPTSGSSPQSNGSTQDGDRGKLPQDKLFTCGICKRSFGYKHVLQNHERTHTGEKPFECLECHKRFTRDHHLKTHMRLHTGEKPYHCTHCDRQFVQVANLRRHLRVHTGERPYACELCASKFSDSNQLKAHMLIHKGEKPFPCTLCNGKFRRRHHLMHHKCPSKDGESLDDMDEDSRETELEIDEDVESEERSSPELPSYLLSVNNNRKVRERKSRDIRRVVRVTEVILPEQTEPEDLSMPKSKLRTQLTQNNNHQDALSSLYHHPKFRRHVEQRVAARSPLS